MKDQDRLRPAQAKVLTVMQDGKWYTLNNLCARVGLRNEGSVASRIRDLKATKVYDYERRSTDIPGVYEYRLFEVETGQLELPAGGQDMLEKVPNSSFKPLTYRP